MVHGPEDTGEVNHLRLGAVDETHLVGRAVVVVEGDHRIARLAGGEAEEVVSHALCAYLCHEHTRLLCERLFGVHDIGGVLEDMLGKSFLLVPCYGFLALLACLDIHASVHEEGVLSAVVRLSLGGAGVSVFHCRIGVAVSGFPVLGGRHVVVKGRTEELRPVDLLLALGVVELDILGVGEFVIPLLNLVLLGVLPAFGVRPEGVALLEVLGGGLFLQLGELLEFGRVEDLLVVLVERRAVDHVVHAALGGGDGVVLAVLEGVAVAELEERLEILVLQRVLVAFHAERGVQTLERAHFAALVGVLVLAVDELVLTLLKVGTLHFLFEVQILCQFWRFLNCAPPSDAFLHFGNVFLERFGRAHFAG